MHWPVRATQGFFSLGCVFTTTRARLEVQRTSPTCTTSEPTCEWLAGLRAQTGGKDSARNDDNSLQTVTGIESGGRTSSG
jgi:hypothetical protein